METKTKEAIEQAAGLVTLLQFIISAITGVITYFAASTSEALIVSVIVFLLLVIFLIIFKKAREVISIFLLEHWKYITAPKRNKEISNKYIEYTYHDREHISMKVQYSVKFYHGAKDRVEEKLSWTAGKVENIKAVEANQIIEEVEDSEENDIQSFLGYQFFNIKLPKTYSSQDGFVRTGFESEELIDEKHKSKPCVVTGIYDRTDKITIRIRFNVNMRVNNIRKQKYIDFLDMEPYYNVTDELKVDEADSSYHYCEFVVNRPILGGKCAVDWVFGN